MTNPSNSELTARTNLHNFFSTVKAGLYGVITAPRKRAAFAVLTFLNALLCTAIYWPQHFPPALNGITLALALFVFLSLSVLCAAAVGYVPGALDMQHNFARVGFVNSAGEAPYLICKEQHGNVFYTYCCTGFPFSSWVDNQLKLETALNMLIATVKEGKDRRTIKLCCVPPEHAFEIAEWHDRYIYRNEDNLLLLGRGLTGDVIINIDKTPHILIGGNTGSGKTILLQCLVWQAIQQAALIFHAHGNDLLTLLQTSSSFLPC